MSCENADCQPIDIHLIGSTVLTRCCDLRLVRAPSGGAFTGNARSGESSEPADSYTTPQRTCRATAKQCRPVTIDMGSFRYVGDRLAARRSFASSSFFGSVITRSRSAIVKSSKSSASSLMSLPTRAPSLPSSLMQFASSRKSDGSILLSNGQGRRRPNSRRCLAFGCGFVLSVNSGGSKGRVTKSTHSQNMVAAAL